MQHSVDITDIKQAHEALERKKEMKDALNKTAVMFLSQNNRSFEDMMTEGMGLIVDIVGLDRLSVWRNFSKADGLHMSQIYRWDREEGGTTLPKSDLNDIAYSRLSTQWEEFLADGGTINGPVNQLNEEPVRRFLEMFGVVSAFLTPIFMDGHFWGFALFEDRRNERWFDDDSSEIMRTAGFLCANAVIRAEMMTEIETALFEAKEANRVKSEFLSRMSHEMLTPMHIVTGMTNIAKRATDNPERLQSSLDDIDKASRDLLRLIRNVLDLSGKKDSALELTASVFDFNEMIHGILDETGRGAAEKQQTLTFDAEQTIPAFLIGDKRHLSRVIGNILTNSIKFTPEHGKIHISVSVPDGVAAADGVITLKF
jgi:signal transduction histidine kinase